MLDQRFLDELRSRTLLSGLIGRTVKLTRAGREFKACCPFHNEKTPSFYINDEKGFYHCFGCQAHGDAIRWLTDQRGLPFMDAIKELADAAGLEVPAPDPRARERADRAAGLHEVMEAAASWFVEQLDGVEGTAARSYLKERGTREETRRKFGLGLAPDSRGKLKAALASFGTEKLIECGLLIAPEDNNREPYDRFRGRLMFPIRDARGRCIAFSGRIIGKGEPKYLNSPDTPIFDKGRTLFNIDRASPASRATGRLIVVEGQMDVVGLSQAGIDEAVAPLGTALTETQIQTLWRVSDRPLLCFDGDAAGQKATARAARRALPFVQPGHTLGFVQLPPGKDPDDLVRSGATAALMGFLANPETLVQRIWRAGLEESDLATPEGRAGLNQRLVDLASSIENPFVRDEYKRTFREMFWEQFGWRKRTAETVASEITASRKAGKTQMGTLIRAVLLGLSRYPDVLRDNLEMAAGLEPEDPHQRQWLGCIIDAVLDRPELDEDLLGQILEASMVPAVEERHFWKDLGFSFFYKRDQMRGKKELKEVLATLAAERELAAALSNAKDTVSRSADNSEWEMVQSLLHERHANNERISAFSEQIATAKRAEREGTEAA